MNDLSIASEKGKYDIILRDIERGYVIIEIKSSFSYSLVDEATEIAKKYNPKKIYISAKENTGLKLNSSVFSYSINYELTKAFKDVKLVAVELSNRLDLINKINNNIDYFYKSIDNYDVMEFIKNKSAYYFTYKKEMCGCIIVENDEIKYLTFDEDMRYSEVPSMCLSKALYHFSKNLTINVNSKDEYLRSLVEEYGFENKGIVTNYYEV